MGLILNWASSLHVDTIDDGASRDDAKVNVPTIKARRGAVKVAYSVRRGAFGGPLDPPYEQFVIGCVDRQTKSRLVRHAPSKPVAIGIAVRG
jgi:hypothetical protein